MWNYGKKWICEKECKKYRMALVAVLVALVVAGVVYCMKCYSNDDIPSDGTLVKDLKGMKNQCDKVAKDIVVSGKRKVTDAVEEGTEKVEELVANGKKKVADVVEEGTEKVADLMADGSDFMNVMGEQVADSLCEDR